MIEGKSGLIRRLPPLLVAVACAAAFANSFSGVFLFDDHARILSDPNIRRLSLCLLNSSRPLVNLTLHLNYRIGGFNAADYHAVNLVIHLIAGLALFGILRRALLAPVMGGRYQTASAWLAACAASLWVAHPLQTESVTYIIQRAESLMGMFYLLTLYAFIRSTESARGHRWETAAVVFCALGMASKPVMVTAPLMVWLYDRAFVAGSAKEALRRRPGFYAGLAATWLIPLALLSAPHESAATAGFATHAISAREYLAAQPAVVLHYLRLAAAPSSLCFDYAWAAPAGSKEILAPALAVGALVAFAVWASVRRRPIGFAAAWFFLVLAPSSSFVPVADCAAEHRLYLPLAGFVTAAVLLGYAALSRLLAALRAPPRMRGMLAAVAGLCCVGAAAWATRERNTLYAAEEDLWRDVVAKRPANLRARDGLVSLLLEGGRFRQAERAATDLIGLVRGYADGKAPWPINPRIAAYCYRRAENHLGLALLAQGRAAEAVPHFQAAIAARPAEAAPYHNLALALLRDGRTQEATAALGAAVNLEPNFGRAYALLASIQEWNGEYAKAAESYGRACAAEPEFLPGRCRLAWLLATCPDARVRDGRRAAALAKAICEATDYASVRALDALGAAYAQAGRFQEAARTARRALAIAEGARKGAADRIETAPHAASPAVAPLVQWDVSPAAIRRRVELYEMGVAVSMPEER